MFDGALVTIVSFIVLITVVVFFHELGHFWVARRCGVRVEVFSVGFGPELFGFTDRHGTRWRVSALPLGGYVKMFGQSDVAAQPDGTEKMLTPDEAAAAFSHKKLWQRAAIVFAGPAANYVLAAIVFMALFASFGQTNREPVVGEVIESSPAATAGLRPGDRILQVGGNAIERFQEITTVLQKIPGDEVEVLISRDGQEVMVTVRPELVHAKDGLNAPRTYRRLGIAAEIVRYDIPTAALMGVEETYDLTVQTLVAVGQMIAGTRSSSELGGILRIGEAAGETAKMGVSQFLYLIAVLSINLGLINLFPIPLLDGGHLAFYAYEGVRGRPLGARAQDWGFRIGIVLILALMIFATWNDLVHLRVIEYLKNLVIT